MRLAHISNNKYTTGVSAIALSSRACANYVTSAYIATRSLNLTNIAKGSVELSLSSKNTFKCHVHSKAM